MKIAILISGQLRTNWFCMDFIKKNIILPNDGHVFIFTGTNCIDNKSFNLNEEDTISSYRSREDETKIKINEKQFLEHKLGYFLKGYNKNDFIENYWKQFDDLINDSKNFNEEYINKKFEKLSWKEPYFYVFLQYLALKKCMEMLIDYEIKNNDKFDYIVRLRPDMALEKPLIIRDIISKNNADLFTINNSYGLCCLSEYFFFGKADIMKNICLNFVNNYGKLRIPKNILDKSDMDITFITETQFYLFIENLNIKRVSLNGGARLIENIVEENEIARENKINKVTTYFLFIK